MPWARAGLSERHSWVWLGAGVTCLATGALIYWLQQQPPHTNKEEEDKDKEEELRLSDIEDAPEEPAARPVTTLLPGGNSRQGRRRRRRGGLPGEPHPYSKPKSTRKLFGEHVSTYPAHERLRRLTEVGLMAKTEGWTALGHKCDACWMLKEDCLCGDLAPVDFPMDFVVLMHYKEWHRASNTGHLLTLMHPTSEILIQGKETDDQRVEELEALALREPYSVVALMPCEGALSVAELRQKRAEHGTSGSRLRVILLDGTWRQARGLNRRLTDKIARVRVDVLDRPTQFVLRTRTRKDGISTIEAALMLVEEFDGGAVMAQGIQAVLAQVATQGERVLASSGKPGKGSSSSVLGLGARATKGKGSSSSQGDDEDEEVFEDAHEEEEEEEEEAGTDKEMYQDSLSP